ncbi:MAG: M48 family metallopeptidase, partial [Peptococcaceae bacterium]|nr:M48 family metallopeptidase [Peptococcaceae bacterium]
YTLTRSKRKTIALYIRDGGLEVRAPLKMAKREIDRFIASNEKWIADRLAKSRVQTEQRRTFRLSYGDTVTLRGAAYPLVAQAGTQAGFDGERLYLPPNLAPEQIKAVCVHIYRQLAKPYLTARAAYFAGQMNVTPSAVRISGAKTQWGSCSARRSLNFSWRLILADDGVIDYVVVHELAHLTEMNHSARFWAIVENVLPDYRARQAVLRELQKRLDGENWDP